MATIKDIADEVGISKAAVSRILNHKGSFSAETTEKVWRVAKRLNYLPSGAVPPEESPPGVKVLAAIFPQEESPFGESPYYSVLISLLEKAAYDYGYDLMLCGSLYNWENEEDISRHLRERNISGVILGSFSRDVALFHNQNIPVVTVGQKSAEAIPAVRSDNYASGRVAARHLLGKGCRKLLYITSYWSGIAQDERYKGYADELRSFGLEPHGYQLDVNAIHARDVAGIVTQMALANPDADGLFAENYSLALECLRVYAGLGYRIPQDIKIIGYGNSALTPYSIPQMTVVKEDTRQIARRAVSLLVDLIENPERQAEQPGRELVVPVSLEVRQTT